jgi:hypothetical protein
MYEHINPFERSVLHQFFVTLKDMYVGYMVIFPHYVTHCLRQSISIHHLVGHSLGMQIYLALVSLAYKINYLTAASFI